MWSSGTAAVPSDEPSTREEMTITTREGRCCNATYEPSSAAVMVSTPSTAEYHSRLAATSCTRSWMWEKPSSGESMPRSS
jgi:hypothetical protein